MKGTAKRKRSENLALININLLTLKKDAFKKKKKWKKETLFYNGVKNSPTVTEKGTEWLTEVDEAVGGK